MAGPDGRDTRALVLVVRLCLNARPDVLAMGRDELIAPQPSLDLDLDLDLGGL